MFDLWSFIFFFKQKTAYEMRISDWSSDVCSSDLFAGKLAEGAGAGVAQAHAGHAVHRAVAAEDIVDHRVPAHLDLGVPEQPVLADLLGAQGLAAVNESHLGADVGEVERFLDGGVAAADHHHLPVAVEEAVAGDRKSVV